MTEEDWAIVLQVFEASRSRRGDKGRDDKKFLSALHYFAVHNITWRALPAEFGNWNSVSPRTPLQFALRDARICSPIDANQKTGHIKHVFG
jgi:transposase